MPLSNGHTTRQRVLVLALAVVTGVVAFGYRFLSVDLTDDDYLFFAVGRQIQQFGEWPVRDLAEEGDPLHNVISAALQAATGYRLAGEVFFDLAMLSIAAALTFILANVVSGSAAIAVAVTALAVLYAPRLYDYPKALALSLGLWLCFRYVDRPSRLRAAVMGTATGVAFLVRHDLGAYLGIASLSAIVAAQLVAGATWYAGAAAYAVAAAVIVLPFALYVERHGGLREYVAGTRRFVQREVGRDRDNQRPAFVFDFSRPFWERAPGFPVKVRWAQELEPRVREEIEHRYGLEDGQRDEGRTWKYTLRDQRPENLRAIVLDARIEDTANIDRTFPAAAESAVQRLRRALRKPPPVAVAPGVMTLRNAITWLYYVCVAIPWIALAALGLTRAAGTPLPPVWTKVVITAIVAAVAAPLWLRGNLYNSSRLADLAVPTAVLGAFLLARAFQPRRHRFATVGVAVVGVAGYLLTAGSIVSFAQVAHGVDAALVVLDPDARRTEFDRRWRELLASPPSLEWVSRETGMRGAVEYLRACTAPDDRVFVYGFYPEIVFFSGRASSADRIVVLRGFWTQPQEQRRTIAAIQRVHAPVVLIDVDAAGRPDNGRILDGSLPLIDRYLGERYVSAGVTGFGASTDVAFNVLVDRNRQPTGTYERFSLPCFVPGA